MFDDLANITQNEHLHIHELTWLDAWDAALSGQAGTLKRPLSMLSFALNYYFTGDHPFFFKLTNLLIHLLNGCCVFVLTRLLLRANDGSVYGNARLHWASLAVAALWLLHPLNLTSVLYIVQRMNSLAALFTFCALVVYCWARFRLIKGRPAIAYLLTGVGVFGVLALLCKENGVLLPLYMLVIEITFFRFRTANPGSRLFLITAFLLTVVLPGLAVMTTLLLRPQLILNGYELRDFTWIERLLTEARVLWYYLRLLVLPNPAELGLYHDDFALSHDLLHPFSTLFAVGGLVLLLGAGIASLRRQPVLAFGILWFLAGHLLESTLIPLELVYEHRNYLPGYGILFTLIYYLTQPHLYPATRRIRALGIVLLLGLFTTITALRADQWRNLIKQSVIEAAHHPLSSRANFDVGEAYHALMKAGPSADYYREAVRHFETAVSTSQDDIASHVALIIVSFEARQPIRQRWLDDAAFRLEHRTFVPSQISSLQYLEKCQIERRCKLSDDAMVNLFESALRNHNLNVNAKAAVYSMYGAYTAKRLGDPNRALSLLAAAANTDPSELQYQLDIVGILIAYGQYPQAQSAIDIIQVQDSLHAYNKQLLVLKSALQQRMKTQDRIGTKNAIPPS
ncbi:MAG: hypothetical protein ACYC9L_12200 [Sulfuricaulis sp.]